MAVALHLSSLQFLEGTNTYRFERVLIFSELLNVQCLFTVKFTQPSTMPFCVVHDFYIFPMKISLLAKEETYIGKTFEENHSGVNLPYTNNYSYILSFLTLSLTN